MQIGALSILHNLQPHSLYPVLRIMITGRALTAPILKRVVSSFVYFVGERVRGPLRERHVGKQPLNTNVNYNIPQIVTYHYLSHSLRGKKKQG